MATLITATAILRGKVIDGTHHSATVKGEDIPDAFVGQVIRVCRDNARRYGWHMADPNIWVRVEFRSLPD